MKIESRLKGDVFILDIEGRLVMNNCQALLERFMEEIHGGRRKLAFNFEAVAYADSAALATMIEILKVAKYSSAQICLYAVPERVRSMMEVTNLLKIFTLVNTEKEALETLNMTTDKK